MIVKLNGIEYLVNSGEFEIINHPQYTNLHLKNDLALLERITSLIKECTNLNIKNLVSYDTKFGGFLPLNCSHKFENVFLLNTEDSHKDNILFNIKKTKFENIHFIDNIQNCSFSDNIIYASECLSLNIDF
jgi:hypothetical protein